MSGQHAPSGARNPNFGLGVDPATTGPLNVTASVIAVVTAALQSAKALYDVIDGLVDAPHSVSQSKSLLSQTQTTLGTLRRTLGTNSASGAVDSVLREIELSKALKSTQSLCQEFATTLTRFTSHSTDLHFSTRDRVIVQFNESKIKRLNRDLADCQRTITMVFSSVTLIVSNQTSGNIDQLRSQFDTQEPALADLGVQLSTRAAGSQANDDGTAADGGSSAQLTASLQEVCQKLCRQPAQGEPGRSLVRCGQTTIRSLCKG